MAGAFESAGVQSKKVSAWGSLFVETYFEGLNTNRAQFHPGGTQAENKYYGGRPGQLLGGKNVELNNLLSLQRRPGLSAFTASGVSPIGGTIAAYSLLSSAGITNTGATLITGGNIGAFPTNSITGFTSANFTPPAQIVTATAQNMTDLTAAFTFFNGLTSTAIGGSFATTTFTATPTGYNGGPGFVGKASSTLHFTGGIVTLDGAGLSNPVFVFQVGSGLNVDTAATTISLINGAIPAGVIWVVGSAAIFDAHVHTWVGNILATSGVTLNGGSLAGRAFATTGPVTISSATAITVSSGAPIGLGSSATYPTPPLYAFAFPQLDGTIRDIIDTGTSGPLTVTSAANATGTRPTATTVYTGTFPYGANNGYVGMVFTITGFTNLPNNGSFVVIASSITQLTLLNPNGIAETIAASAITSGAVWWDQQNGSKQLLFAKTLGAGQSSFVAVAGILYAGDGVDTWIWNPSNTGANGQVFGFGIPAPIFAPQVVITASGAASVAWAASTEFTTMGLVRDTGSGDMWQLQSVNAAPPFANTTQFGLSGNGQPHWNQTPGGTTSDTSGGGNITWTNKGPIVAWTARTTYNNATVGGTFANPCIVYDPVTQACYVQSSSATSGVSGSLVPAFKKALGQHTNDGSCVWIWVGPGIANAGLAPWLPSQSYPLIGTVSNNDAATAIVEPNGLQNGLPPVSTPQTFVYFQASGGGTSGSGYTPFGVLPVSAGSTVVDNNLLWMSLGLFTWAATTAYSAWAAINTPFSAIFDSITGDFYVCTVSGVSGGTVPVFNDGYGVTTVEASGLTWTNVGDGTTWVTNTKWYLPVLGFFPPSGAIPYGGASVIDNRVPPDVEFVTDSGLSGAVQPTWNPIGQFTTDNTITWFNEEAFSTQSLAFTKGYSYAYSYKSRSLTDFYTVNVLGTSTPPIPPGLTAPLPFPTGSLTGDVSSASPATITPIGANPGSVLTITGPVSTNPAVDTIVIWRSADGGGSANMFELTEIPNLPNGGPGTGTLAGLQTWSFRDFLPDVPTTIAGVFYPGLNVLIPAPINGVNNPPPLNFRPQEFNFDRIWGISGNMVVFSGGPDTRVGNPNSAFNAADEFTFLANPVRAIKIGSVLIVFTPASIEVISGGPATGSFFTYTLVRGVGLLSWNFLDAIAGEVFFFGADSVLRVLSPNLTLTSAGFPIQDELANVAVSGVQDATWNPSTGYLAILQSGNDNMIVIADGATGWYRLNPRQQNGSINGTEPIWSPFAAITNGCKMVVTVETSPGIKKLLVGATTGGQQILKRDTTVFTDNGTQYDAFFVQGTLALARRGELSILRFLEADFSGVAYHPTVSYLLNEAFSSTSVFTPFTLAPQFDPPTIYGATLSPTSYSPNRYYFAGVGSLARCIFLTLKVDFGTTANADTIYNLSVNGAIIKGQ